MAHIAYEKIDGRGYTLARGTAAECSRYVGTNPIGPRGGSTHVRRAAAK